MLDYTKDIIESILRDYQYFYSGIVNPEMVVYKVDIERAFKVLNTKQKNVLIILYVYSCDKDKKSNVNKAASILNISTSNVYYTANRAIKLMCDYLNREGDWYCE